MELLNLDPMAMASDPLPHTGATLSLTAGASGGGQVMLMAVIMNGGQMCVAEFQFSIVGVDLTAHRPDTEFFDFMMHTVPDDDEKTPGAGIRFNGDDDNNNMIPDNTEDAIPDNDLIKMNVALQWPPPDGVEYVVKRSNSNIKVWLQEGVILDTTNEEVLDFDATNPPSDPTKMWAESVTPGAALLTVEARDTTTGQVITSDKIRFSSFQSIVIALSGEKFFGGTIAGSGVTPIAEALYDPTDGSEGYDVHLYDENFVNETGAGIVFDEVVSAITDRDVANVAMYGHSHGGGSAHDLALLLSTQQGLNFNLSFTGYIGAIKNHWDLAQAAEKRMPTNSLSHLNFWQNMTILPLPLNGAPTNAPGPITNIYVNGFPWGENLRHGTIDNSPVVQAAIEAALRLATPTP